MRTPLTVHHNISIAFISFIKKHYGIYINLISIPIYQIYIYTNTYEYIDAMAEIIDLSSVNEYTHINVFISCLIARIFLQQQIVLFK